MGGKKKRKKKGACLVLLCLSAFMIPLTWIRDNKVLGA